MARAFLLVMDSFGIGAADDAAEYGDVGANTFGHIAEFCAAGKANKPGVRQGSLQLPTLSAIGLFHAAAEAAGNIIKGAALPARTIGSYGFAAEKSLGKDTPSGHWEMAGVPVMKDWGYFPYTIPCFPEWLTQQLITQGGLPGILGNKHASGTVIIDELGAEHMATGKPIIYTSADSVLQIAAHETTFGLAKLYALCDLARKLVDKLNIGRVIARPFLGNPGSFKRTANRRDLATPPPEPTLLDFLLQNKRQVFGIGKIPDIFAHQGFTHKAKGDGNSQLFEETFKAQQQALSGSLTFTNFVDFDMLYGHRRDVVGYAKALEQLDHQLLDFIVDMQADDLAIISADHGCDPTWQGTDHTREFVPVLAFGPHIKSVNLGKRRSFADIGQTIAEHLGISSLKRGTSFLSQIKA